MKKIYLGNLNKDVTITNLTKYLGIKLRVTYKNLAAFNCQRKKKKLENLGDSRLYYALNTYVMN